MKKIVLTASVLSAMIVTASAQQTTVSMTRNTGTTVGVHAGVNFFNINGKDMSGNDLDNKLKTGFSAGVNVAFPLGGGAYLQPGVDFTQKGAEAQGGSKVTLNYIDIPVNFVYKPLLGSGNLVLGFGPYVGFGMGGKIKASNGSTADVVFKNDYDASSPAGAQFRKTDAGANLLAGYEFANNLSLNLKAQLGLMDISPDMGNMANDKAKYRNTGFGLSLGYRF